MSKLPRDLSGDHRLKLMVPVHVGKPLRPKVLSRILREAGLTVEELLQLL